MSCRTQFAVVGEKLGMLPADGVVGDGQLAAFAADQYRSVGQLESPPFVRTLQYQEGKHEISLSLNYRREKRNANLQLPIANCLLKWSLNWQLAIGNRQ